MAIKLAIWCAFTANCSDTEQPPNRFSPEQGFPWTLSGLEHVEIINPDFSEIKISYNMENLSLVFGKFIRSWGPRQHSLIISSKPPSYPQFGLDWHISSNLNFSYFHGELFSSMVDTHRTNIYAGRYGRPRIYVECYITAHRLEWTPLKQITLDLNESLIYGGRGVETLYLIPFIPLLSAEHYLVDSDNLQMSADLT